MITVQKITITTNFMSRIFNWNNIMQINRGTGAHFSHMIHSTKIKTLPDLKP